MQTYAYGFPRLGKGREYKKIIEKFWNKEISDSRRVEELSRLQQQIIETYERHVDTFPVGEMTGYDNMLDTAIMLGLYRPQDAQAYYGLCRGHHALPMKKWFNTNYHYLVPDLSGTQPKDLNLHWNKAFEYRDCYRTGSAYLIGPFTFMKLSQGYSPELLPAFMERLSEIYSEAVRRLGDVHVDEPAFVLDVTEHEISLIEKAYRSIAGTNGRIHLFTYYQNPDFLTRLYDLPFSSIGLDFIHGPQNFATIAAHGFPKDIRLIAGIVDGRNVWRTNIERTLRIIKDLSSKAPSMAISNAGPLYHLPVALEGEQLPSPLSSNLAFAEEKLEELNLLGRCVKGEVVAPRAKQAEASANHAVRSRISSLRESDFKRSSSYSERAAMQRESLCLPLFPTTTIGSFPQTPLVRGKRADWKAGRIQLEEYTSFLRGQIADLVHAQEEVGLDVLVHGEFERTDMVEFFAEALDGIATTANGWVLSYGTRCYRPPIIFGDVSRPRPMTLNEIRYAQQLTERPVKGMLTGPVTILAWSFVREDTPVREVAYQIALCLRDEIMDYVDSGIRIVQIDEPALRERAPLKKREWPEYFDWAVGAFGLASSGVPDRVQIHTHMCYSQFGEMIDRLLEMDFDVISIESARTGDALISSFAGKNFDRMIGLGVWDIHSPAVPTIEEMEETLRKALAVFPKEKIWINPDCGLKTRGWDETMRSLQNMVAMARSLRQKEEPVLQESGR